MIDEKIPPQTGAEVLPDGDIKTSYSDRAARHEAPTKRQTVRRPENPPKKKGTSIEKPSPNQ